MNRFRFHIACLALCLCLSCDGCKRKGKPWNPNDPLLVTVAEKTERKLSRRETAQLLLQMVPARSQALVVLDLQRLYRLAGELEAALKHTAAGGDLIRRARQAAAGAPVKVPWAEADLARLGLDSRGAVVVFGVDRPEVFVLPIKDKKTFLTRAAVVLGQAGKTWRTEQKGGRTIHGLPGARCHLAGGRATCAASGEKLMAALDQRRQRSLWDAMPRDLRARVERTTALFTAEHQGGRITGSLRVETDGVSLDVRATGGDTVVALTRLAGAGEGGTLLGLARGAESVLCLRLNARALLAAMPALAAQIEALGLAPAMVAAALTGEVLVVEQPKRSPVLLLGSKDGAVAGALVKAAARALARLGQGKGKRLKVIPVKDSSATTFDVQVARRKGQKGSPSKVRLMAAPGAILLGEPAAVAALAPAAVRPPPPATFLRTLGPAGDRAAFGPGLVLASRSMIREPFASLPGPAAVEQMIGAGQFPAHIKQGFSVLRFLYDQLHHQTLGVVRQGDGLRLVLRLTTLHRHGHAVDDRARAIFINGLEAKHAGDLKAYNRALRLLKKEYMGTRYGGLLKRRPGGLSGPVVALGAAAAVLLPVWAGQAQADAKKAGPP